MSKRYSLEDLLYLMERLRDPETGCPWDIEQTLASIVPHTLEEAYEVADAIEREDFAELPTELGDLLFQVVFYSQIAHEQNRFAMHDVIDTCVRKLIRRHPHVFPEGTLDSRREQAEIDTAQVAEQWQAIKAQEARHKPVTASILDEIPLNMPALTRAAKLQKKAATVGFNWPDIAPVVEKLHEEVREFEQALAEQEASAIEHELGDLLFTVVNLARFLKLDPERALRTANQRFATRFQFIERQLEEQNKDINHCDLDELDALWEQAKLQLSKKED